MPALHPYAAARGLACCALHVHVAHAHVAVAGQRLAEWYPPVAVPNPTPTPDPRPLRRDVAAHALAEAADLLDKRLITRPELEQIKAAIIAQIMAG